MFKSTKPGNAELIEMLNAGQSGTLQLHEFRKLGDCIKKYHCEQVEDLDFTSSVNQTMDLQPLNFIDSNSAYSDRLESSDTDSVPDDEQLESERSSPLQRTLTFGEAEMDSDCKLEV